MKTILLILSTLMALPSAHALEVFACEPEWAALTKELAGSNVSIFVATSALQDVHQIEARPSLIAKMRRAELLVCTGAELELGWLPQLLTQAGNSKLNDPVRQFFAAEHVELLDKPAQFDRSGGDVHAAGNPHVHLDPLRVGQIAQHLSQRLITLDPDHSSDYQKRAALFSHNWQNAVQSWQPALHSLRDKSIVVSHDNLRYLAEWVGLNVLARLEPKPGLPPTSAHLAGVLKTVQSHSVYAIVQAAYEDPKSGQWLADKTHLPHIIVPYTVGGIDGTETLIGMMDKTLQLLTQVKK